MVTEKELNGLLNTAKKHVGASHKAVYDALAYTYVWYVQAEDVKGYLKKKKITAKPGAQKWTAPVKAVFGNIGTDRVTRYSTVIKFVEKKVANTSHNLDTKHIAKIIEDNGGVYKIADGKKNKGTKVIMEKVNVTKLIRNLKKTYERDVATTFAKIMPPTNSKDGDLGLVLVRVNNGKYEAIKRFDVDQAATCQAIELIGIQEENQ